MSSFKGVRALPLIVPGLLLVASSCATNPERHWPPQRRIQVIVVDGNGIPSPDPAPEIFQKNGDEIVWVSAAGEPLTVEVTLEQSGIPFEHGSQHGSRWKIKCNSEGSVCTSGHIRNDLRPPDGGIRYKYSTSVLTPTGPKGADPFLIIKP